MNWKSELYELSLTHINDRSDNDNKLSINIYSGLTLLFKNYFEYI